MSGAFPLPSERKCLYLHGQPTDKEQMVIADLNAACRYYGLHPKMKELMEYVLHHDFSGQEAGRITLDGRGLFINLDEVELKTKDRQRLEFHRRYIDVQVPLLKEETMGWMPVSGAGHPRHSLQPRYRLRFLYTGGKRIFQGPAGTVRSLLPRGCPCARYR